MIFLIFLLFIPFIIGFATWIKMFGAYHTTGDAKISEKSWHFMYMKWCLKEAVDINKNTFRGLCNYAWAVFAVITFSVIFWLINLMAKVFNVVQPKIEEVNDHYNDYCEERSNNWLDRMTRNIDARLAKMEKLDKFTNRLYQVMFYDYIDWTDDIEAASKVHDKLLDQLTEEEYKELENRLLELKEKEREEERLRDTAKAERERKRKALANNLASKGKWVLKGLGVVVVLVAVYYTYLGSKIAWWFLTERVAWGATLNTWLVEGWFAFKVLLGLAIVVGLCVGIYFFIKWSWCKWGAYCIPCQEQREAIAEFFVTIWVGLTFIPRWIWGGLVFTWAVIKNYKEDNCPMIEWEEESL